jgi:hypothetical protein
LECGFFSNGFEMAPISRTWLLGLLALALLLPLTGCLFRSRPVPISMDAVGLQTATQDELIERINDASSRITTLNATVDISATVGGSKQGKITEYQEIHGYILIRKPSSLRMVGLYPILQNRMFDMVSNGEMFKLWIPSKNEFIVGDDQVVGPSARTLENLRPRVIYDALLLQPSDPQNEITVLEQDTQQAASPEVPAPVLQRSYTLNVIRRTDGGWRLARKAVFYRSDLQPHEQIIYGENGLIATDAFYADFTDFAGIAAFPTRIRILRPQEEYSIELKLTKLSLNGPVADGQFELEPPSGARRASQ